MCDFGLHIDLRDLQRRHYSAWLLHRLGWSRLRRARIVDGASKVAILASFWTVALAAEPCGSFIDAKARSVVDFAPPSEFVDICSRASRLCSVLTKGFPSSVQTIGYFVPVEEWRRYEKGKLNGFSRYLIAQRGGPLSRERFREFKDYVREQHGDVPDSTDVVSGLESQGRVSLGVTNETEDSITYGVMIKQRSSKGGSSVEMFLASINIAVQLRGESLSLYVNEEVPRGCPALR